MITGAFPLESPGAALGLVLCLGASFAIMLRGEPRTGVAITLREVGLVAMTALGLRFAFMMVQTGAVHDMDSYWIVGKKLAHGGDIFTGVALQRQNYPPVVVWWSALCATLAPAGGQGWADLERSLFVLGDAAVAVSLLWVAPESWRRSAAMLYALSPVAIAICTLHGQFDSLVLLPLLWSLHFLETRRVRAGALLGVAVAVKTWPLFFLPVIIFRLRFRKAIAFLAAALVAPVVAFAGYAAVHPGHILAGVVRMLTYAGVPSPIGFGALFPPYPILADLAILLAIIVVAWILRRAPLFSTFSCTVLLLLGLSATVSDQYLVWPLPSLLAGGWQRLTIVYSAIVLPTVTMFVLWANLLGPRTSTDIQVAAAAGWGALGISIWIGWHLAREARVCIRRPRANPEVVPAVSNLPQEPRA